ncbi:MAG TPA: hypothetical protein VGD74_03380, partial [Vulgatibacter sp.]
GEAARPAAEEGVGLPEEPILGPRSRKSAAGAALAMSGAALGGMVALWGKGAIGGKAALGSTGALWGKAALGATGGGIPPAEPVAALAVLVILGLLHLPLLPAPPLPHRIVRIAGSLRGLAVFCGAAFLVARPLSLPMVPGSIEWWRSPAAVVMLFGLAAAISGAGHAIRRPGRIGPAPVAGALVCAGSLAFLVALGYGLVDAKGLEHSPDAAVAACVISMLFVAWSGPLSFGESELPGAARRLSRLPAATVALGLAVVAIAGR